MNSINIIGRLTRDVELRYIPSTNTPVCSFDIAVDDGWGDKKKTFFFKCQAWQKTAENIAKFFGKGDLIGLSGRLTTRDWIDKEDRKHTVTEIVVNDFTFCNGRKSEGANQQSVDEICPDCHKPIDDCECLPF